MRRLLASPSLPYVLPFAVLLGLVGVMPRTGLGPTADNAIRILVVGGLLVIVSRGVLDLRPSRWLGSSTVGLLVFAAWILPDLLWSGYRESVIFSNPLMGRPESSFAEAGRGDPLALALRFARAALVVPVAEELFWRGWLPRWLANTDFRTVPLGHYTPAAFAITAGLFALEHGSWWDVGLLAGVAYNWWMMRTRRLGDCILAHAVTNACLGVYVMLAGKWEFW
jgi:CAAX prenyl protease-like protein